VKRYKHSLSNTKLFSCDMGELVPCGLTEVLPGDSVQLATNALVRASPLLAPVMHPVNVRLHHWFVPHRLVWDDWEDFITGGPTGMDASVFPTIAMPASTGFAVGSLADYLGLPTGVPDLPVSALPFRAYAMIFNEWYRDQDLVTALTIDTTSGVDTTTNLTLQNCAWEKDYFTSSRPWEVKGPAITVPLGAVAPVTFKAAGSGLGANAGLKTINSGATEQAIIAAASAGTTDADMAAGNFVAANPWYTKGLDMQTALGTSMEADLSAASAISVNVLREALALQRYQEARARYGSRYTEYLQYLGVKSSDGRLQRPEYLGGGQNPLQLSEVLQTAADGSNPVGTLRGHGISTLRSNRFRRFFEEHGYIITLCSIRPKTIYGNGMFRTWNRRTKEDFWQKELEHIGQQEILVKEVYAAADGAPLGPDDTFGFQDRYDEYRRSESTIAGEFRTTALDYWHLARIFSSDPALNATFVNSVPTKRVFASQSTDVLYVMANNNIQARRPVAFKGTSFIY